MLYRFSRTNSEIREVGISGCRKKRLEGADRFFNNRFIALFKNKILKLKSSLFFLIIKETMTENLITLCND